MTTQTPKRMSLLDLLFGNRKITSRTDYFGISPEKPIIQTPKPTQPENSKEISVHPMRPTLKRWNDQIAKDLASSRRGYYYFISQIYPEQGLVFYSAVDWDQNGQKYGIERVVGPTFEGSGGMVEDRHSPYKPWPTRVIGNELVVNYIIYNETRFTKNIPLVGEVPSDLIVPSKASEETRLKKRQELDDSLVGQAYFTISEISQSQYIKDLAIIIARDFHPNISPKETITGFRDQRAAINNLLLNTETNSGFNVLSKTQKRFAGFEKTEFKRSSFEGDYTRLDASFSTPLGDIGRHSPSILKELDTIQSIGHTDTSPVKPTHLEIIQGALKRHPNLQFLPEGNLWNFYTEGDKTHFKKDSDALFQGMDTLPPEIRNSAFILLTRNLVDYGTLAVSDAAINIHTYQRKEK